MNQFLTLKDHVYHYIAEEITKGNLKSGEKINENNISEKLNISRTPVREALIQLSSEGFLENLPRRGFVIKHMDVQEACDTYFIIGLLDGASAEIACSFLTEKHLDDMGFYIDSMDLAIEKENYEMYYKCQESFHNIYLECCPNRTMVELQDRLKKKFLRRTYLENQSQTMKDILFATNEEHRILLSFFKEKKAKEANAYLREIHWAPEKAKHESI